MTTKEKAPAGGTAEAIAETAAGKTHDSRVYSTTHAAQSQVICKSLRTIAFEVNRIASVILLAGLETQRLATQEWVGTETGQATTSTNDFTTAAGSRQTEAGG